MRRVTFLVGDERQSIDMRDLPRVGDLIELAHETVEVIGVTWKREMIRTPSLRPCWMEDVVVDVVSYTGKEPS